MNDKEKCKERNSLYYYFGRNAKHDYPAVHMRSGIMCGVCGSGKSAFLNSLLIRTIQETNPNELNIFYYDFKGCTSMMWRDSIPDGKLMPHFRVIDNYPYSVTRAVELQEGIIYHLGLACEEAERRRSDLVSKGECTYGDRVQSGVSSMFSEKRYNLIVIDEYDTMPDLLVSDLNGSVSLIDTFKSLVLELCSYDEEIGIYVLLIGQRSTTFKEEEINRFPIKLVTRADEKTSQILLKCNLAACDEERCGLVYVKYTNDVPMRLFVPFYPDTWIRKFIRTYSVIKKEV